MEQAKCPYCKGVLEKVPSRKKKCPFCKESIFIKSTPTNRTKRLMTENEALSAEEEWGEYHQRVQVVRSLKSIGVSEAVLDHEQNNILKTKSINTAYLSLLKKVANGHVNLHNRQMAHHYLARELSRNNENYLPHLKEAAKYELLGHKNSGVEQVQILTVGKNNNSCDNCEKQSGAIFDINEALTKMPIPCSNCTHPGIGEIPGYCRCTYAAYFSDA